jgi:hypothetical protein
MWTRLGREGTFETKPREADHGELVCVPIRSAEQRLALKSRMSAQSSGWTGRSSCWHGDQPEDGGTPPGTRSRRRSLPGARGPPRAARPGAPDPSSRRHRPRRASERETPAVGGGQLAQRVRHLRGRGDHEDPRRGSLVSEHAAGRVAASVAQRDRAEVLAIGLLEGVPVPTRSPAPGPGPWPRGSRSPSGPPPGRPRQPSRQATACGGRGWPAGQPPHNARLEPHGASGTGPGAAARRPPRRALQHAAGSCYIRRGAGAPGPLLPREDTEGRPVALLHCAGPRHAEAATSALHQLATVSSPNATASRRVAGSAAASS